LGENSEEVEIDIFEGPASVLNSLKKEAMNQQGNLKETIQVKRGDDFCRENNITQIDLLKIDTEGFEIPVLKGFSKMISESRVKAIYCEVGFSPKNLRNTYVNDLMDFAAMNDFIFFGMYEVSNIQIKRGTNYGNILFVNKAALNKLP
jgi:hypothetical protein